MSNDTEDNIIAQALKVGILSYLVDRLLRRVKSLHRLSPQPRRVADVVSEASIGKRARATSGFPFPLLLLVAGCSSISAGQATDMEERPPSASTEQARGSAFAQTHCSHCHAIEGGFSPRPEAPSFAAIINTPGLTDQTMETWLGNSHNFPEIMDFAIAPEQIDDLAQYMLTLKDENYRPPMQ